jgi:hypothetical protein
MLVHADVDALRGKFAAWPRTPQAVTWEVPGGLGQPDAAPEQRSVPQRDDPGPAGDAAHCAEAAAPLKDT